MAVAFEANQSSRPALRLVEADTVPLPELDTTVEDWYFDERRPEKTHRGTLYTDAVTMSDGHTYPVVIGKPNKPITETPIVFTTAWFTSTHGHNRHVLLRFMEAGFSGVLIGSEGVHRFSDEKQISARQRAKALGSIALSASAHSMHEILNEADARDIDAEGVILLGESRGAMVGMGFLAYAPLYRRIVSRADLSAPCFPEKLDICHIPELAQQIVSEPRAALKFFGSISLSRMVHYPSTVDLHPQSLAFQLATAPALFGGEAGALARHIPIDQQLHITTFKGDFASMPAAWDDIFAQHLYYSRDEVEGAHVSIANVHTLKALESRVRAHIL